MTGRPSARNSHGILRAQAAGLMLEGVESAGREAQDWLISREGGACSPGGEPDRFMDSAGSKEKKYRIKKKDGGNNVIMS